MKGKKPTSKPSRPLRNSVIATVIGGTIVSAIPPLRDLVAKAASFVAVGFTWVWTTVTARYSFSGWVVLVFGLFSLFGIVAAFSLLVANFLRPHRSYVEDMIDGAIWRWSWSKKGITDLWCFCPNCDLQLGYAERVRCTDFICERCPPVATERGRRLPTDPPPARVVTTVSGSGRWHAIGVIEREILRRVRTGEFRKTV